MTKLTREEYLAIRDERATYRSRPDCVWDGLSKPAKVLLVAFMVIYFGGGLIVPLFW